MPVTQKDIADRLRLSRSLVGAVLSNKAGEWVSAETKRRILDTAAEMHYRPHAAAKALRSGKTQAVAFHFFPPQPWSKQHTGSMIETLAEELAASNYRLIVSVASESRDEAFEELLTTRCCDAVILYGEEEQLQPYGERLEADGIPFVMVADFSMTHPNWLQVDFDQEGMMEKSVAHLLSLGHRNIAYLGHDNDRPYALSLLAGFKAAHNRYLGADSDPFLIARIGSTTTPIRVISEWLSLPESNRPTAVVIAAPDEFVWNDIEIALAQRGQILNSKPSGFSAVGLADGAATLLYGEAYAFRLNDRTLITQQLMSRIVGPLLRDVSVKTPILRVCPPMESLFSHRLLEVSRLLPG